MKDALNLQNTPHLTSILSRSEETFIDNLRSGATIWLGGSRAPGDRYPYTWTWTDGSPWGYTNWLPKEPNGFNGKGEYYIEKKSQWNDHSDASRTYVCKYNL